MISTRATTRIALLDWGIGGLGVLRHLRASWPCVPILYISDTGAPPYGRLSRSALSDRVRTVLRALGTFGITHVLVACNAASTVIDHCRDLDLQVAGMIGQASTLLPRTFRGKIGVLGGQRTIRSGSYRRALASSGRCIVQRVAQPLSAHIEAGTTHTIGFHREVARIMAPLRNAAALILACTHYPAIATQLRAYAPRAQLIDPGRVVARAVIGDWPRPTQEGPDQYLTTGDPDAMRQAARLTWQLELGVCQHLVLESCLGRSSERH